MESPSDKDTISRVEPSWLMLVVTSLMKASLGALELCPLEYRMQSNFQS